MLEAAQQQGPPMPRPSHLMILALAAALYIYALASDNTLLALLAAPADLFVFGLAAFLCAHLAYLRGYCGITLRPALPALILTQSGARSFGSCYNRSLSHL